MGSIDYFRSAIRDMHKSLIDAVQDLTDEQLYFRPLDQGNHIAFIIWHCVRTEDMVLNFLLQKKPPVWNEEGWDKKLDMDPRAQGTGMSAEEAAALRIKDMKEFSKYMENAFRSSEAYLDGLNDEDLDQVHELAVLGKRSLYEVIGGTILQHAGNHLGEIWYIKGLQGLKGSLHGF
ncbi:MAG: DinB family protein [Deltaproteobacteria bacterium]|nr:DinB family protein [Deltaproteobacteria bacterium]